ncbi:MAG: hypothetical protein CL609_21320 [Anaerolineaceae bacterium]|nr:hypothetical protein [Anaerolineaceae bacterium]
MPPVLNITWKELLLNFRDRSGLILMFIAPFALILVIGAAFGGFSSETSATIGQIPVVLVNHDQGEFSTYVIDAFYSEDLSDLVSPSLNSDESQARLAVDNDQAAAAVIIPANFSESIYPKALQNGEFPNNSNDNPFQRETSTIEVYRNPSRVISSGIIRSIVDTILDRFVSGGLTTEINILQMIQFGLITLDQAPEIGEKLGREAANNPIENDWVSLKTENFSSEPQQTEFDWLTYSVPSMAILYLMFTINAAGRSILTEKNQGTLSRMLVTPTTATHIIGGKMLGAILTGVLQMTVILLGGTLLYSIQWGSYFGLILLTLAIVAAATGWSMIIAAFSQTPGQASAIGTAITLTFAAAAGNFLPRGALPEWLQNASLITPNGWGLEGYTNLSLGNGFESVLPAIIALFIMALVLFLISSLIFRRQYQ